MFCNIQHAIAYVEGDKYYGAKATMNVWEPKIQQSNEFSLSQIWILGGLFGQDLNSIEAGLTTLKQDGRYTFHNSLCQKNDITNAKNNFKRIKFIFFFTNVACLNLKNSYK